MTTVPVRDRRLRVLVSAYACGPDSSSEPGVGWNTVVEVAREHDVWVITSFEHRRGIEAMSYRLPSATFVFLDWPHWLAWIKCTRAGFEFQQYAWQVLAFLTARRLHRRIGFDIVHHVTLCRYWMPSFMAFLGAPFIWGSVGGGESAPKSFWPGLGPWGALLEAARAAARWFGEHDPYVRSIARRSVLALATTPASEARMRRLGARRTSVLSQVALTEEELDALAMCGEPSGETIRFLSVGRCVSWKGFHLGLRAFARVADNHAEYWLVGDGPASASLRRLAHRLGVADRVRFLGALARADVLKVMSECHVLIHPSLHDSGAIVCMEAMAAGRPVVCLDLGGPAVQVTTDTGFKVAATDPECAVTSMAAAMSMLRTHAALRGQMSRAARARARAQFNWRDKGQQFTRWYRQFAEATSGENEPIHVRAPERTSATWEQASTDARCEGAERVPVVSAVMPTYNMAAHLGRAISSVVNQSFEDWELILVDDGSTDATQSVIAGCRDPRIRSIRLGTNRGRAAARNVAVRASRGPFIAICDSDDVSVPNRFERQVAFLRANPDIDVVSGYVECFWENGTRQRIEFAEAPDVIRRRFSGGKMALAHGASMIRATCFERHGLYCEELATAEDFEFFHRMHTNSRFCTTPEVMLFYRREHPTRAVRQWLDTKRCHRYALYRSRMRREGGGPVLTFEQFVTRWGTRLPMYTVDLLRFVRFNLRSHVYTQHVVR